MPGQRDFFVRTVRDDDDVFYLFLQKAGWTGKDSCPTLMRRRTAALVEMWGSLFLFGIKFTHLCVGPSRRLYAIRRMMLYAI